MSTTSKHSKPPALRSKDDIDRLGHTDRQDLATRPRTHDARPSDSHMPDNPCAPACQLDSRNPKRPRTPNGQQGSRDSDSPCIPADYPGSCESDGPQDRARPSASREPISPQPLHDLHVHLDFMANGEEVAHDAHAAGTLLYSNTVTPAGYATARDRFVQHENVRVGLGMHPWWVDAQPEAAHSEPLFDWRAFDWETAIGHTRFIGEIGLDFGKRHASTRDAQQSAFGHIAQICAEQGGKLVSLHSVKAACEVLDVLERTGMAESCTCIFHWYSGPSDQLKRAIDMGCLFSVGPRMLATGRGREYVKALPAKRLLLETDAPPAPDATFTFGELRGLLETAACQIAAIKGPDALETIVETSARILG